MISDKSQRIWGMPRQDFQLLAIAYLLAHGGILLILNAVYWDDWTLWPSHSESVLSSWQQAGSMFNAVGWLHWVLLKAGPWLYRVLTLGLVFGWGVYLYRILERQSWLPAAHRLAICLLFVATPLYGARVALIDFQYTLCVFLFLWAWFELDRRPWLAFVLFMVSFNTSSLLVFYALPLLDLLRRQNSRLDVATVAKWAAGKWYLLAAPIVWYAVKLTWFRPYGAYAGYNEQFGVLNLLRGAKWQFIDFMHLSVSFVTVLAAAIVAWRFARRIAFDDTPAVIARISLAAAVLAVLLAVFPYWVLGYTPKFAEWNSRHQLLMPLGVAGAVAAAIMFATAELRRVIFLGALCLSFALNWTNYAALVLDWKKQKALIGVLAKDPSIRDANLVVFDDHAPNAFSRTIRFYEWNGLLRAATGREDKFGVDPTQVDDYLGGQMDRFFQHSWNAGQHVRAAEFRVARVTLRSDVPPEIALVGSSTIGTRDATGALVPRPGSGAGATDAAGNGKDR